jgi:DNA-binding beta-propeller fold protein YncE
MKRILSNLLLGVLLVSGLNYTAHPDKVSIHNLILSYPGLPYLSPSSIVASPDGKRLYIACTTANQVVIYDVAQREILRRIDVPASPSGLALSADGQELYATCSAPKSRICIIATATGKLIGSLVSGHTAMAPVLSQDGRILYVCNRFNNAIEAFDLQDRRPLTRVLVDREPVAAVLSRDGTLLFVANHIQSGRADQEYVAATVSVIDTVSRKLIKNIPLANGSSLLRGICVSPNGKYVGVTHALGPNSAQSSGRLSGNALCLIDVAQLKLLATVLLDEKDRGAANPWAVAWSPDGKLICVTHAGTDEISLINAPALLARTCALPDKGNTLPTAVGSNAGPVEVSYDLDLLTQIRTRVKLHGKGPRCLAVVGKKLFIGNYFTDSLSIVDLALDARRSATIQLESPLDIVARRKGEMYFNDATLCYQGRQSCASCHSSDARVDGMNWDLRNASPESARNVKSLLFCFQTPAVMSTGIRSDASGAIRTQIREALFTEPQEQVASAIDEYIKTLQVIASPHLFHNRLSSAARRGQDLFFSDSVGCARCHRPPLFTDLRLHAIASGKLEQSTEQFLTPALIEAWRTAPYFHDGSAATLRDVVLTHNPEKHAQLTRNQVEDLVEFLLAL